MNPSGPPSAAWQRPELGAGPASLLDFPALLGRAAWSLKPKLQPTPGKGWGYGILVIWAT